MDHAMKVMAINTSPRKSSGTTALVFDPFVEGMRSAGADVEVIYTRDLDIRPCDGDFRCWWTTPGQCRYRDEMDLVLPRLGEARIWVLGVPVYLPMPGEAQNLLNRLMPLFTRELRIVGRRMYPARDPKLQLEKIALVSSCGYFELENFNKLVCLVAEIAEATDAEMVAPVLRQHADEFSKMLEAGDDAAGSVVRAAHAAGSELVATGRISPRTCAAVSAPLLTFDEFVERWNEEE